MPIKNRPPSQSSAPAELIVSPDVLALVRFGLRAANDPRIVDTVKVIDELLKVETPLGPAWYRYNQDGYGEHEDGSAFDGTGIGRAWPLLTGERAHYELAAGNRSIAVELLYAMERFASEYGFLSEQIWEAPDIPEKELFFGKPSGSAMPLVWAHAEYVKLLRSLKEGRVFDTPDQTYNRYVLNGTIPEIYLWRSNAKRSTMPLGKTLRVETYQAGIVEWSDDGWQTSKQIETIETGLGIYYADLETKHLPAETMVRFKIQSQDTDTDTDEVVVRIQN